MGFFTKTPESEAKRVKKKKDRSFTQRNAPISSVVNLVLCTSTLISFFTLFPAVYGWILNQTGSSDAAFYGTSFFGIVLEVCKYYLTTSLIDDYFDKTFEQGGAAKVLYALKFLFTCFIWFVSIYGSIEGAPQSSETWAKKNDPLVLKTEDNIREKYALLMQDEQSVISATSTRTHAKKLTEDASKSIQETSKRKLEYARMEQAEIDRLDQDNELLKKEYEAKLTTSGNIFRKVAGVGEFIAIICYIFFGIYDEGIKEEKNKNKNREDDEKPDPTPSKRTKRSQKEAKQLEINQTIGNTGLNVGNTGFIHNEYTVHHPEQGLPYVVYNGKQRSLDWINTQISTCQSKLNRNEDREETVKKRKRFFEEMRAALLKTQAA